MMRGYKFWVCLMVILGWSSVAVGATSAAPEEKKPLTVEQMYKMDSADLLRRTDATAEEDYQAGKIAMERGETVEAQGMFERAAKKGHTGAMIKYGEVLARAGFMKEAVASYRQAAELGDPEGEFLLGSMYLDLGNYNWQDPGVKIDSKEAFKWIKMAAEQDYAQAINLMASAYASGGFGLTDAERTNEEILKWLHKSADFGDGTAMDKLADAYREGKFGLTVDEKMADDWHLKATKAYGMKEHKKTKARKKRL